MEDEMLTIQKKWRDSFKSRDIGWEILEKMNFGQAKRLLDQEINKLVKNEVDFQILFSKIHSSVLRNRSTTSEQKEVVEKLVWCATVGDKDLKNKMRLEELFRYMERLIARKSVKEFGFKFDVEGALDVPLEDIYDGVLTVSGARLKGICPFHDDSSPSLVVYPETNSFYCFGCSAGGNVINYVMKEKNCSFTDAVNYLCKKNGKR